MPPPVRILLLALAGVALLVPTIVAAQPSGGPPVTTPVETTPPPPEPAPPVEVEVPVEEPVVTITLEVPPLPEPSVAAPKPPRAKVAPARAQPRRVQPRRVERASASEWQEERADEAPAATEQPKAKPKPKPKLKKKPTRRGAIAPITAAPQEPIRDRGAAQGVLAAQFSTPVASTNASTNRAILYFALALATVLGMLLSLAAAAPLLAGHWPRVFVPVVDATERIVLAGVCLAGAALTLAITWALTGPAA